MTQTQQTTNPPPQKQNALAPIDLVRRELTAQAEQFKIVLPAHISPEKFQRVAITALQQTPALLKADRRTLVQELLKCATDGLVPDGREAAIVPFNGSAKYMPMVGGLIKRIHQAGNVQTITAHVVYKGEDFEYFIDEAGEHLRYRPTLDTAERSKEPYVTFAIIMMKDGAKYIEVLTETDIKAIRNVSKAKDGPWKGDFEPEMRKKSALRRVSKKAPTGADLDDLLSRDDEFYDLGNNRTDAVTAAGQTDLPPLQPNSLGDEGDVIDVTNPPPQEAARPDKKPVYNHAPGAANPPPKRGGSSAEIGDQSAFREPAFDQSATRGPETTGSVQGGSDVGASGPPSREELVKNVQAHMKALGLDRTAGEAKILKLTNKTPGQLTLEELAQLDDVLHIEVMEKNPNAK